MTLDIGHHLQQGRYQIRALLGRGGMGTVYLATDRNLSGRQVAIKENVDTAPATQDQFQYEAILLSRLTHANLPRVTDHFVEPSGRQYLVMDYIEGDDLRTLLHTNQGPIDEEVVLAWLDQVFDALSYMHHWIDPLTRKPTPIIHRDIKPGNIKQTPNGRIVLVDFGLAKIDETTEATVVGAKAYTPGYSPLEQYTGGTDARSDVYALGATLYTLLTGQRPPDAMARVSGTALIPPRQCNPQISPAMDACLQRALTLAAAERFQTIDAMRAAMPRRQVIDTGAPLRAETNLASAVPPTTEQEMRPKRSRWTYWSTVIALLALVILIVALVAVPKSWLANLPPLNLTPNTETFPPVTQTGSAGSSADGATQTSTASTTITTTAAGPPLPSLTLIATVTVTSVPEPVTESVPMTESTTAINVSTVVTQPEIVETTTEVTGTIGGAETAITIESVPALVDAALATIATVTPTAITPPTVTTPAEPTATATVLPTVSATASATTEPTETPTALPTQTSTVLPTASSTASATPQPTLSPTTPPTLTPTAPPTASATPSPTQTPPPPPTLTPTATTPQLPPPAAGDTLFDETSGATYRFVPAGPFTMGSTISANEKPVHIVTLDSFWLQETEVTNQQYDRCVAAGACTPPHNEFWQDPIFADHPVTHVDWAQATTYATWVGGRLPTEAEWEKAARGDDERIFPWPGEETNDTLLNFNTQSPVAVGSFPAGASPYGLLDMAGNVEEWVNDLYSPTYYAESPTENPPGPADGLVRVVRGGSFQSNRGLVRTTARGPVSPALANDTIGFRVLLPVSSE